MNPETDFENFLKLSIHCGTIVKVETFPKAKNPPYKIFVDFGPFGMRQSSAQLTKNYAADDLIGAQILGILNIPPRNIAGFVSEFLLLGLEDENGGIAIIKPDSKVPNGSILK
ncbi:MAG: tRNA-binding protein [Alphaproteobacteria bacterium PA3]|nr:MAG: tRNA-binding protein [Alphaproteobacteria bacterium PA3]